MFCLIDRLQPAASVVWLPSHQQLAIAYRLLCALWLAEMVRRYFNDLYVLGKRQITHFGGRISFRFHRTTISYSDIREIRVNQSIPGRLLHYGTLIFSTSATGGEEVVFHGIAYPRELSLYVQRILMKASITPLAGTAAARIGTSAPVRA